MSDALPLLTHLPFGDVEIVMEDVVEFEFPSFSIKRTTQGWFLETYDELEEEGLVVIPIDTLDDPFSDETELFLMERYGIAFDAEKLQRLKEVEL